MRWTIRRKLMLSISIPLLTTYLLVLGWDYYRLRGMAKALVQDMALTRVRLTAGAINANLEQARGLARSVANLAGEWTANDSSPAAPALYPDPLRFAELPQSDWAIGGVVGLEGSGPAGSSRWRGFALRRTGATFRPTGLPAGFDPRASAWYSEVLRSGAAGWFGPARIPELADPEVCIYATPVKVGQGVRGVAAVLVPPRLFREVGNPTAGLLTGQGASPAATQPLAVASLIGSPLGDIAVVTAQGQLICAPQTNTFKAVAADAERRANLVAAFTKAVGGESCIVPAEHLGLAIPDYHRDEDFWAAFVPIPASGWVLTTAVSEPSNMQPVLALMAQRAALLLAGLVAILGIVYFVSVRLSAPIERLATATRRIGQGDLQTPASGTQGSDELAELARGFNTMVGQIRQQMEDIRRAAVEQEKVEGELRIARTIQADLLPQKFPPFPGRPEFDLHAINIPARYVAGDFYDFFLTDDRHLMLVIADVSGKGVPAAILMAVTRTIVRNLAVAGRSPLEIVRQVNRMLVQDSPANMFVTMIVAAYDTATGTLRYVNAGHPSPILAMPGATRARLVGESTAPLVGASDDWPEEAWQEAALTLAPGEAVIMYTDGLTEARNPKGELLGEERIIQSVQRCPGQSASALCQHLTDAVECYEGREHGDDLTLLALRRVH